MFGLVMRDALRSLRSAPRLSTFIILILTLGISAATVTFSVVDTVVLRPLPYHDPDRLVTVNVRSENSAFAQGGAAPVFLYDQLSSRAKQLAGIAAATRGSDTVANQKILIARITANLFDVLGVQPAIGRPFSADNEIQGRENVAVISHDLWQSHFGGDPNVVGKTLALSQRSVVVTGVMPPGFSFPLAEAMQPVLWTPFVAPADERSGEQPSRYLRLVARLTPGASIAQAQTEAEALRTSLPLGNRFTTVRFDIQPASAEVYGAVRGWMLLLLGGVALVMLVACANVANLLLARVSARAAELSRRASLGASRRRLFATLMTETTLLALTAGAFGLLASKWGITAAKAALPERMARASEIALDLRVAAIAVGLSMLTITVFGAVPAWQASRRNLATMLREAALTTSGRHARWRAAFLVSEVAFVSMLLVATTLFVSSFIRVALSDLGFERRNLLYANTFGLTGQAMDAKRALEAVPGVVAAGGLANGSAPLAMSGGFGGGASGTSVSRPGIAQIDPLFLRVTPGYFKAAGIAMLAGRDFDEADLGKDDRLIIDARTARTLFQDANPIGAEVMLGGDRKSTVVGLVASVKDQGPEATGNPLIYFPGRPTARSYSFLIRTAGDAGSMTGPVGAVFTRLQPAGGQPAVVRPLEQAFRFITADRRFAAGLMILFGVLGVVIGAIGVYAVTSSIVAQRRREIGIRMALGATAANVVSGVTGHAFRHVALGLAIGLAAAFVISQGFASVFFGVTPADVSTYAIVAVLIIAIGIAAAFIPARRASRIDPLTTIRS